MASPHADNPGKTVQAEPGMLQTLGSLQFGLVVLTAVIVVAVIGTVVPQGREPAFYAGRYGEPLTSIVSIFRFDTTYRSPLFLGLIVLFGTNLVLCSITRFPALFRRTFRPRRALDRTAMIALPVHVERADIPLDTAAAAFGTAGFRLERVDDRRFFGQKRTIGYLGAFAVHLSLLVFIAGGVVSMATGIRGTIVLRKGETASAVTLAGDRTVPLGFDLRLEDFEVAFYPDHPGRPKSYNSTVTVIPPEGGPFIRDIRVNWPLMRNGFTVFQSSYGELPAESAGGDTAVVAIRPKGMPDAAPALAELVMAPGERYPVPGYADSIGVAIAETHRDFQRGGGMGGGERNPAVLLDVFVHGEKRWSVYAFERFPGLNMPMQDDLPLTFTLIGLRGGEKTGEPSYYTVLGVTRDPGMPLIWIGAILIAAGLSLSLYVRPRRLWLMASDEGGVLAAGDGRGDLDAFRRYITRTLDSAKPGPRGDSRR